MDTHPRFHVLDPRLPMRCVPPGWRREQVRDLFTAVYDGPAEPAQEHVRGVAAPASAAHDGITAHTTADLLAGVRLTEDRLESAPNQHGSQHGASEPALHRATRTEVTWGGFRPP
jgi:phenylacetic acid degradation operon negative regulatory protein